MSIKLSSLFKGLVLSIRVDQNSRGVHFGSIGYLLHEEKKQHSITKRQGKLLTKILLHLSRQTSHLLSKADLSSSDQNDPAVHVDVHVPQLVEVTLLPVIRIQERTLADKKKKILSF